MWQDASLFERFVALVHAAALILDRFDLADGVYLGFEDFCVLNGLQTADKYSGSYESRLFNPLPLGT